MKVREWFGSLIDGLGDRIGEALAPVPLWFEEHLSAKIEEAVINTIETIESEAIEYVRPHIDDILKFETLSPALRAQLEGLKVQTQPIQLAALIPFAAGIAISAILNVGVGAGEQVRQESLKMFKPTLLNPTEAVIAKWRGLIGSDQFYDELVQAGYNQERQDIIEEINRYVPNVQDLIQFTVRDVFNEDVVSKYGYDKGFDKIAAELKPHLEKIGMDEEVMKLYWRAHWALPSISQAFEMLHRDKIDLEDIRTLLTIADVAPQFIDPIIEVAYAPYTRVDVRRMYNTGILDREAVMRSYKDIGYDDEHAENLTAWTVAESMGSEKDLNKTEILSAYRAGSLTNADARDSLQDLGYDVDESDLILALQDYKIESALRDREKKIITNQFYYGKITRVQMLKDLAPLDMSEREINITVGEVEARIREKHATPSKTDLKKWLELAIIDDLEFFEGMARLGYSDADIKRYIKEVAA